MLCVNATLPPDAPNAVGAVIDTRLYMALLDGTRAHYFPTALPEFERIVDTAELD